jgi:hypothetical protein
VAEIHVRVIRYYETTVTADYGDTEGSLIEKGIAAITADATPVREDAVILPPEAVDPPEDYAPTQQQQEQPTDEEAASPVPTVDSVPTAAPAPDTTTTTGGTT